ncbi:VacB/RNase II family 3'-5' exoribonuclease [Buchnera aphidicola (Kurisakia onigurumii)]|uniref:VacB/RNase II family 3'-5' exoribonuclease n=1 Tax=Buchnera aphidicola TaxID=9 RepID=UPI0031B688C7
MLYYKKKKEKRSEVIILKVLNFNSDFIISTYYCDKKIPYVIPIESNLCFTIFIKDIKNFICHHKNIVLVKLYRNKFTNVKKIKGKIIRLLGNTMNSKVVHDITLLRNSIPYKWNKKIYKQVNGIKKKKNIFHKKNRYDFRHIPFVTIDDKDAYDFDDAVYCEKNSDNSWFIFVAISDVSHFVKTGTPIDIEAKKRGMSLYLPLQVISMLPDKLSTDICSLKPNTDRFALVCKIHLSKSGDLLNYKYFKSIICSKERLTYSQILKIWNKNKKLNFISKNFFYSKKNFFDLYLILKKSSLLKNKIPFENYDSKIITNKNLNVINIINKNRNIIHEFIELCMILTNYTASDLLLKNKEIGIFRVHNHPKKDRIIEINFILKKLNLPLLNTVSINSSEYVFLLKNIAKKYNYNFIQNILLRSMKKAVYNPINRGHFGLSLKKYTHFTSPIRRYSDLFIHRIIKDIIKKNENNYNYYDIKKMCDHLSSVEKNIDYTERWISDWMKKSFLKNYIGCIFFGFISNINKYSYYIKLNYFFIEGIIRTSKKNQTFFCDINNKKIFFKKGSVYFLGDYITVKIKSINLQDNEIELSMV